MCKNTDLEERRPLSAAAPAQTAAEIPPSPASVAVRLRPSRLHADADGPLEGLPVVSSEASEGKKSDEIEVGWPFVCKVLGMLGLLFFVGLQLGTHAPSWIEKPGNSEFVEEAGERSDETDHKDYLVEFLSTPSPGRDRIIDLIVDEYTDPHSIDKSTSSRLDDALSMLDKLGSDGEPVQVEGRPYLFVGSVGEIYFLVYACALADQFSESYDTVLQTDRCISERRFPPLAQHHAHNQLEPHGKVRHDRRHGVSLFQRY